MLVLNSDTGTVAQRITYDEFGVILDDTNEGFIPFGFASGLWEPETGLVRFGARDYDPVTGRWTSKDPIGFLGGVNLFEYVMNDPVNAKDIWGLAPNGCGPAGTNIVPDSGKGWDFKDACDEHDINYERDPQTNKCRCTRRNADDLFLMDMLESCWDMHKSPSGTQDDERYFNCVARAGEYYYAVKIFGWMFYCE